MTYKYWLLAMVLMACQAERSKPLPYATLWQTPNPYQHLNQIIQEPDTVFNTGWRFVKGVTHERLVPDYLPQPDSLVELPHRVLFPNTALWYEQKLTIPEKGVLIIHADDGAQLWINGEPAERIQGDKFKVAATTQASVLVRVLNNAMFGGLRRVSFLTQAQYENTQQAYENNLAEIRKHERAVLQVGASTPLLIGPWLTRTDSVYTIRILADEQPVKLYWGIAANQLTNSEQKSGELLTYRVNAPKGNWYYKICSGNYCSAVYEVAAGQREFSFTVWGDSQSGWYNFQKLIHHMQLGADAFTIGAGDLVGNGSDAEQWRTFSGILSGYAANKPAYLVAGNHDYDGYYTTLYPHLYHQYASPAGKPYFAWTYANCAFIALDANTQFPIEFDEKQQAWFYQQLQSDQWKQATWRFIVLHQPPYSQGWPRYEGDAIVRNLLEPVMESAQIDFVIAGHTHDYERLTKTYGKQQTHFIITGGGGGSLEPDESSAQPLMDTLIKTHHYIRFRISNNNLNWFVYDLNNNLLDKQHVAK
ncbi:MAG: metallophosphoesterase [Cyclobacteriaceae bacterium]|nr:metallophosphoesterase [Cyclobacteriaceae bacterium]